MDKPLPDDFDPYPMSPQVIQHHHHGSNGNGNKLNAIILGCAAFGMTSLIGIALWQMNRLSEKQDDLAKTQAQTNERLTAVETKVDIIVKESIR